MAAINRADFYMVIVFLYVFLQYPSPMNAQDVFAGPPHGDSIHTVQRTRGGLPFEHPLQPSVEELCGDLRDYKNFCINYFQENANASTLAKLMLDLGEPLYYDLEKQMFDYQADDNPVLKVLYQDMWDGNFSFFEARMLLNHPKTLANAKRMDAIGKFPRLADLLRRSMVNFRDKTVIQRMMEQMQIAFYVLYTLTVEVVWTAK